MKREEEGAISFGRLNSDFCLKSPGWMFNNRHSQYEIVLSPRLFFNNPVLFFFT